MRVEASAPSEFPDDAAIEQDAGDAALPPLCVPSDESCNDEDDDCDGEVDENVKNECGACGELANALGTPCSNGGQGECALPGEYQCMGGSAVCNAPHAVPGVEVCDGMDNDCDGTVDEDVKNACGGCMPLANAVGSPCSAGVGECAAQGTYGCAGTEATGCSAVAKAPTAEVCDGKDNDCDGMIDNGGAKNECGGPCSTIIVNKVGLPCSNDKQGICAASGTYECAGANTRCNAPYIASTTEKCDGLDNDCNGVVDDATAANAPTWTTFCPDGEIGPVVSCHEPALPHPDCHNAAVF